MGYRSYNIPKLPETYPCGGCKRDLNVMDYKDIYPDDTVPTEKIHRHYNSHIMSFSMMCTCGHYTIVDWPKPSNSAQ